MKEKRRMEDETRKKIKGFTLVEMTVTMTIFFIVSVGVGASFLSGMKIWDRAKDMNFIQGNVLLTLEMIARELRQSIDVSAVDFEGTANSISFATFRKDSVFQVTYSYESAKGGIIRREVGLNDIINGDTANYVERRTLAVENFSVQYRDFDAEQEQFVWVDEWIENKGVFNAVKLTVNVDSEEYSKIIFIPISG